MGILRILGGIFFAFLVIVPNAIYFGIKSKIDGLDPPKATIYTAAGLPQIKLRRGFDARNDRDLFDLLGARTGLEVAGLWHCSSGCSGRARLVMLHDKDDRTSGRNLGHSDKHASLRKLLWDNDSGLSHRRGTQGTTTHTNAYKEMATTDIGSPHGRIYLAAQVQVERRRDAESLLAEAIADMTTSHKLK